MDTHVHSTGHGTLPRVASVRPRQRKNGSIYWQVRFRCGGQETSESLNSESDAADFADLVDKVGGVRAREMHNLAQRTRSPMTVEKWVKHHINHLSGIDKRTGDDYRRILRNDIASAIGTIPIDQLTRDDIARWITAMADAGSSGKTIANKHGLLSAALNGAVTAKHIPANPAAGVRLPRTEQPEMRFLTKEEFATLYGHISEHWRPMVKFLAASGCRLSEATALRPSDVDTESSTVRISRAWKSGPYRLGPPKTKRSRRTISLPASVLDELDYTGEWLFVNSGRGGRCTGGGPVRPPNFRANVWWPALAKAELSPPQPRIHDLRHTCASWMIQAGVPLPVIQQHLGHENITTTVGVYGHLDRKSAQAAADAVGAMIG